MQKLHLYVVEDENLHLRVIDGAERGEEFLAEQSGTKRNS
jgi:hypothetical protein